MTPQEKITDAELNALLDGELTADERASVESRLADDPESARKASELDRISDAIRTRYAAVLDEPLPQSMQAAIVASGAVRPMPSWRRAAAALALLLAGGAMGYLLGDALEKHAARSAELVGNALSAHSVYVSEVRHPVEVGASDEAHLVKWLTKRLGADVRAPNLSEGGYRLLGGRLLPTSAGPAAQFMYENASGSRLTLFVRRAGSSENTAFQFADAQGLSAFYWIDQPLAYALVGEMPREELLKIARSTYEQLN